MSTEALKTALAFQARGCDVFGSPFSAAFLRAAAADAGNGGLVDRLFAPFAGFDAEELIRQAVALRFLAAFHDLALAGVEATLSAAYPASDRQGDGDGAWSAARRVGEGGVAALAAFMRSEPQTNEARRSACLLGGFLEMASAGLPLRSLELGASAGLNQSWDRFHYQLGEQAAWGPEGSTVRLQTDWRGALPRLGAEVRIAERGACDRAPIDLRSPKRRRALSAYIWADQAERMALFNAAADLALDSGVRVAAADAVAWTTAKAAPRPGVATVLYHSIFWQYLSPQSAAALTLAIIAQGERASPSAPFAWLRMEPAAGDYKRIELRLTRWPGGEDRLLAEVHPHGAWVSWLG